jgi:hypothetical protein
MPAICAVDGDYDAARGRRRAETMVDKNRNAHRHGVGGARDRGKEQQRGNQKGYHAARHQGPPPIIVTTL